MCKIVDARALAIFLVASLECSQYRPINAQEPQLNSRNAVVRWLRHQEELVRSAECEMEFVRAGNRAEMIPLIEEVCRLNKRTNYYRTSENSVRQNTYAMRWWRSGAKERYKKTWQNGNIEEAAFDGQTVRKFDGKDNGSVDTMESAHWASGSRIHPYSLLYTYFERPFSDVIDEGLNFRLTQEERDGVPVIRVQVNDRKEAKFSVVLLFSRDGRVVERQIIGPRDGNPKPSAWEIHVLSDYQAHSSASGEAIWFPRQAVYHYYMGEHPTAGLVEYQTTTIRIKDIKFNVDIPDDFFNLRIPRSAKVWDGVTGLGFLKPGDRPEHLFPEEARRKRWITVSVVVAIALALTIGLAWYRKRRRRLATT